MSSLYQQLILIAWVVLPFILIWLPYVWPPFGRRFRRKVGPWLINFDTQLRPYAYLRDTFYIAALWLLFPSLAVLGRDHPSILPFVVGAVLCMGAMSVFDRRLEHGQESLGIAFLLAAPLSRTEVQHILTEYGGLIPGRAQPFIARFAAGGGYVWVRYTPENLNEFDPLHYQRQDRINMQAQYERLLSALGAEPQTMLTFTLMEGGPMAEEELAAMQVMCQFAQQWACAVVTNDEHIYDGHEICTAMRQGRPILGFSHHLHNEK